MTVVTGPVDSFIKVSNTKTKAFLLKVDGDDSGELSSDIESDDSMVKS